MQSFTRFALLVTVILVALAGCSGSDGTDGQSPESVDVAQQLFESQDFRASIITALKEDPDFLESIKGDPGTEGLQGLQGIIQTQEEPKGPNCSAGGYKVQAGTDANADGVLDTSDEGVQTVYVCNGENGESEIDESALSTRIDILEQQVEELSSYLEPVSDRFHTEPPLNEDEGFVTITESGTGYGSSAVCPVDYPVPVVGWCKVTIDEPNRSMKKIESEPLNWDKPQQWAAAEPTDRASWRCEYLDLDNTQDTRSGKFRAQILCRN